MEWFERHKPRVEAVFHLALLRIEDFPPPLNKIGLKYAEKYHPANANSGQDYICLLLPFWIKELTDISDKQCERLALANIYGMLYFFIQDDLMDSQALTSVKSELALANLLQLEMLSVFRELFSSDSSFWIYYGRYVTTWADCVMNESDADYFMNDPIRTAGKAAPVKLSSTGACLLSSRDALIPDVEAAVDIALMTLQMLDDWADWQADLAEGSYNGLSAMIALEARKKIHELTMESIEAAIYVQGAMNRYAEIAIKSHERLLEFNVSLPSLMNYHSYMVEYLVKISDNIDRNKRKLLGGGINFLS
jgi:hypothetical protein